VLWNYSRPGSAIAQLQPVRPRLKAVGLAAMTLVTVGGLARRARRQARARQAAVPTPTTVHPRYVVAPNFSADEHQFLSEASALLGTSLDYDETVERVASLGASFLADWCAVYLTSQDDSHGVVKAAHAQPRVASLAARFENLSSGHERPPIVQRAIDTRQAALVPSVSSEHLAAAVSSPEHLEVMKQLQVESLLVVPLVARDQILGAIALVAASPRRRFTDASVPLARELARRSAMAIANAMQHRDALTAIQARDEILAVVAHDLRSPLHVIEFAAERLRQQVPGPRRRSADRSLDWILNATQRATTLVRDLLDRARLEWQASALDLKPVDAIELVREIARRAEPLGTLSSVRVNVDVPPVLDAVSGDRDRLTQVLDNLVGNAIKFTPKQGSVTLGARAHDEGVRFFVTDTGPGIDPDDLERVFDRFWQARGADARGAGLGLSICKRIIEAHGGRVWVESRVGEGTTVSFMIARAS
jgi:signal transduction histidine kinase